MAAKKPLSFNMDSADLPAPNQPTKTASAKPEPQGASDVERKQVGARIPVTLYRKLKAHAALKGIAVQETVEIAVADYLDRHAGSA